eukprot:TRINITY_DN6393_c0_g1_i1.p1 TRINITY_DN6393_c0_g1~~TRINITY_DN6393_c0_g1_i1.p1  ORF type:complete len:248 (-),score=58.73 TRINITY_DN6393_c0_g1_i1:95-733(-)
MESESTQARNKSKRKSLSELSINTLPFRLFLVSLEKEALDLCMKPLLHLAFYSESNTFFSFTETDEEISIIVDEASLARLKATISSEIPVVVNTDCWKAIRVEEGAQLIDETGIVANLANPLKEAGIGMLYLSAYECDLILVAEADAEKAASCLFNKIFTKEKRENVEPPKEKVSRQILATALPARLALATLKNPLPLCMHQLVNEFFFYPK